VWVLGPSQVTLNALHGINFIPAPIQIPTDLLLALVIAPERQFEI
jgi:hypothetical protein